MLHNPSNGKAIMHNKPDTLHMFDEHHHPMIPEVLANVPFVGNYQRFPPRRATHIKLVNPPTFWPSWKTSPSSVAQLLANLNAI